MISQKCMINGKLIFWYFNDGRNMLDNAHVAIKENVWQYLMCLQMPLLILQGLISRLDLVFAISAWCSDIIIYRWCRIYVKHKTRYIKIYWRLDNFIYVYILAKVIIYRLWYIFKSSILVCQIWTLVNTKWFRGKVHTVYLWE